MRPLTVRGPGTQARPPSFETKNGICRLAQSLSWRRSAKKRAPSSFRPHLMMMLVIGGNLGRANRQAGSKRQDKNEKCQRLEDSSRHSFRAKETVGRKVSDENGGLTAGPSADALSRDSEKAQLQGLRSSPNATSAFDEKAPMRSGARDQMKTAFGVVVQLRAKGLERKPAPRRSCR